MSRRETLARAGCALGVLQTLLAMRRLERPPNWLTVVTYHRVNRLDAVEELDAGVLDATPEALDQQLSLLTRYLTPVSLPELLDHLDGRPLPPNPLLVTFDDGYLDNYEIATPVLLRNNVAATFFIATAYVAERHLFWWDRLSWTLKHAQRRRWELEMPHRMVVDLDGGLTAAERQVQRVIKTVPALGIDRFLDHLAEASRAPWNTEVEGELVRRHMMTWDHVRALRRSGMHVGAHTRTHRVLQMVPVTELGTELAGARADLEAVLREPVLTMAYPIGQSIAADPTIRTAVAAAGYRLGFSYHTGLQDLRALDALDVHRINVDFGDSPARVLARAVSPQRFG